MASALCLFALVSLLALPADSAEQTPDASRGEVTIVVSDATGDRVADASVVITRGTERRTTTTPGDGTARFANVGAGEWIVTVTREGFARLSRPSRYRLDPA